MDPLAYLLEQIIVKHFRFPGAVIMSVHHITQFQSQKKLTPDQGTGLTYLTMSCWERTHPPIK